MKNNDRVSPIINAFYRVYDGLGYGFRKDVYLRALMVELDAMNLAYRNDCAMNVYYEGVIVGAHEVDLLVNENIIVVVKAEPFLTESHECALESVVLATCCEAGLLFNFGTAPELFRRIGEGKLLNWDEQAPFSVCA